MFDFCVRTKLSGNWSRYVLRHWYEIPAMLPLVVLAIFEDAFVIGAAVRSLRLIRLLRLMRLVNLFRFRGTLELSTLVYLLLILGGTVIFGAVAIRTVEEQIPENMRT